jgi:hypothetical protein
MIKACEIFRFLVCTASHSCGWHGFVFSWTFLRLRVCYLAWRLDTSSGFSALLISNTEQMAIATSIRGENRLFTRWAPIPEQILCAVVRFGSRINVNI